MSTPRVALIADPERKDAADALTKISAALEKASCLTCTLHPEETLEADVDLAVVVGGDGTILAQGRNLLDRGIPIAGVNVGRLGFLAEFDSDSFVQQIDVILAPDRLIRERMTMEVMVEHNDGQSDPWRSSMNDCVVTSGPPFRMIELSLALGESEGTRLTGDGIIVATPTGSTAYNVSAGGPILDPDCEAFAVTPIAAHSLAFRPIVTAPDAPIAIQVIRANEGSTLVLDGQQTSSLQAGDTVRIRRSNQKLRLVHDPRRAFWETVTGKMKWATGPSYRDR